MDYIVENDEITLERQRETFLKSQADEHQRMQRNRDIWGEKLSKFLGISKELADSLTANKTLREIEDDFAVLTYYVPETRVKEMKERKIMDVNSHIMFWFSISLAVVSVASVLLRLKVI